VVPRHRERAIPVCHWYFTLCGYIHRISIHRSEGRCNGILPTGEHRSVESKPSPQKRESNVEPQRKSRRRLVPWITGQSAAAMMVTKVEARGVRICWGRDRTRLGGFQQPCLPTLPPATVLPYPTTCKRSRRSCRMWSTSETVMISCIRWLKFRSVASQTPSSTRLRLGQ